MKLRIPLIAVLLLVLASCGKDRDPTGPNQPGGAVNGTMTATIDGTLWSATIITPGITGGISAIGASDGTRTMAFAWVEAGTGTYQIGNSVGFNANLTIAGGTWVANATGGTGTLVVTSRTANRIVGTFNFTMNASAGGATGTRNVTQGAFNITF